MLKNLHIKCKKFEINTKSKKKKHQRLKELGYKVARSSLQEGQDFFEFEPDEWDIIVSNPPFSLKDKVLEILYATISYISLFLQKWRNI